MSSNKKNIKEIAIYIEFANGDVHQIVTSLNNKLQALEIIRILNEGTLPVNEKKEDFTFEYKDRL